MNTSNQRGRFITLEGIDGAGKSTQANLLADFVREKGHQVFLTREPGGSDGADHLRDLLVRKQGFSWHPKSEALIHYAARIEHCRNNLIPRMEKGEWVICDRFADSTLAYQGAGQGVDVDFLEKLHHFAIGDLHPDQTFILDMLPKTALKRANPLLFSQLHYESMGEEFFEKVRQGYRAIADRYPERCTMIPAHGDVEDVHKRIRKHVQL